MEPGILACKRGSVAAEYALILSLIGVALAGGSLALGDSIGVAFNKVGACIAAGTCS